MRVFAYCCESFRESIRKVAGVDPWLSPPVTANLVLPGDLESHDLWVIDLHGRRGDPHLYGDDHLVALTADTIRRADLRGAVVFALSCYLADEGSPVLDAFLDAGAKYVIGGDGKNYAGSGTIFGASLLGLWFRRLYGLGMDPVRALAVAKRRVKVSAAKDKVLGRRGKVLAAKDALEFRAFYRKH